EIKIEGPEGKTKMSKFQMPKFGITHFKGKGSKVKMTKADEIAPEPDVHIPSDDISILKPDSDIQDSDASLKIKGETKQDGDGEEKEGHFKMPKFKLPSFSWSPKKESSVKPDSGATLEDHKLAIMSSTADVEVKGAATDDKGTRPSLDLEVSAGKVEQKSPIKKTQFAMPKISLSKIKVPKSQSYSPKVEADATTPKTEKESGDSIQIPDIERSHSVRTEEGAQISIKLADVKIPSLEFSKIETGAPQNEMGVSSAQIDASQPPSEASFQQAVVLKSSSTDEDTIQKTEGVIESLEEKEIVLKEEHEIKAEEFQTEEHQGWFKMPKFRIPAFGRTSSKEKKSDVDIERSTVKAQLGIPSAKVQTETSIPEKTLPRTVAEITIEKQEIPKSDSLKSSDVSSSVVKSGISVSTERTDIVNIAKSETYAEVVKHDAEGQKKHTSEFTVSSAELSKSYLSASEIHKDDSLTNRFPLCTLTLQEHKVKSQYTEVPKIECSTKSETSGVRRKLSSEGSISLRSPSLDHMEASARITAETLDKSQDGPDVNINIPKLKIPKFTFKALPTEADISVSKVVTDPKGSSADIEVVKLQATSAIPEETPEVLEGGIQKAKSKILTLTEPDIKTAQVTTNARQDIHWSYVEGQEISEKVEPEHVAIERCEIYTTEILKESEVLSSEVKTATLGFSLIKAKLPESHSNLEVLVQQPSPTEDLTVSKPICADENFGVAAQTGSAEPKLSDKPHTEAKEFSGEVSLPKLKEFDVEVKLSSKVEESLPKVPEGVTASPFSKGEDVAEALEDEEKDITDEKEKTDSKRSPGRFKFWLPSIGFSSSSDETSVNSKTEVKKSVPENVKPADMPDNDSSKPAEKTGWFRFPKLGFSSPTKKAKTADREEVDHKEGRISDEDSPSDKPDVFFDAQESLSPKEITESKSIETDGASSSIPVSRTIVTSSARTELILLEEEK
ncbi:Protein AHNAK2, partial [Dryobates pubescens]